MLEDWVLSEKLARDDFVTSSVKVMPEVVIERDRINHVVINVGNLAGELETTPSDVLSMLDAMTVFVVMILRKNMVVEMEKEIGIYLHKYMITLIGQI